MTPLEPHGDVPRTLAAATARRLPTTAVWLAIVILAACGKSTTSPPPGQGQPEMVDRTEDIGMCKALDRAFVRQLSCFPDTKDQELIGEALESLHDRARFDPRDSLRIFCAGVLRGVERSTGSACDLGITPDERAEMDAIYNRRTDIPPSGNDALDAESAHLAALRDAACGCNTRGCRQGLEEEFRAAVTKGPGYRDAPAPVREAFPKLVREFAECLGRDELPPVRAPPSPSRRHGG